MTNKTTTEKKDNNERPLEFNQMKLLQNSFTIRVISDLAMVKHMTVTSTEEYLNRKEGLRPSCARESNTRMPPN